MQQVILYTCKVCGYQWEPRPSTLSLDRPKPVACPDCKSRKWDKADA